MAAERNNLPDAESHRANAAELPLARRALLAAGLALPFAGAAVGVAVIDSSDWDAQHASYLRLRKYWDGLPEDHPEADLALSAWSDAGDELIERMPAKTERQFSQKMALVSSYYGGDHFVDSVLPRLLADVRLLSGGVQ